MVNDSASSAAKRRVAVSEYRLGQPRPDVLLALVLRGLQLVQRKPRGHRRQPRCGALHVGAALGAQTLPAQPRLLHDILGVGHRAEHPIRQSLQPGALRIERIHRRRSARIGRSHRPISVAAAVAASCSAGQRRVDQVAAWADPVAGDEHPWQAGVGAASGGRAGRRAQPLPARRPRSCGADSAARQCSILGQPGASGQRQPAPPSARPAQFVRRARGSERRAPSTVRSGPGGLAGSGWTDTAAGRCPGADPGCDGTDVPRSRHADFGGRTNDERRARRACPRLPPGCPPRPPRTWRPRSHLRRSPPSPRRLPSAPAARSAVARPAQSRARRPSTANRRARIARHAAFASWIWLTIRSADAVSGACAYVEMRAIASTN